MEEKILNELIKEVNKAYKENEIPVACIVTKNNKIIAKTHNKKEHNKCSLDHAELIAIKEASKRVKDWRLNDCTMYVTLKPCKMCENAIIQSRIKKVYYIVESKYNESIEGQTNIEKINISREIYDEFEQKIKKIFK